MLGMFLLVCIGGLQLVDAYKGPVTGKPCLAKNNPVDSWHIKSHRLFLPRCVQNLGVIVAETLVVFGVILMSMPKVYDARVASGVFNETLTMVVSLQIVFTTTMLQGLAWTARDVPPFGALLYMSIIGFEASILTAVHVFPFVRALYTHRLDMDPHTSSMHNINNSMGFKREPESKQSRGGR
jgi:hypothetical protein